MPLERICTHPKEQSPAIFTPGIKWDGAEKLISDRFWVTAAHWGTAPGRLLLLCGAGLGAEPGAAVTLPGGTIPGLLSGARGTEVAAGERWHRGGEQCWEPGGEGARPLCSGGREHP